MATVLNVDSPLAQQLNDLIQPKLIEVGWSSEGSDDSALAEYIVLMVVNGKTEDEIATEISGDLLNLGPDDPGARDFASWLFAQLSLLQSGGAPPTADANVDVVDGGENDAEMGDIPEGDGQNVPTGPRSMRSGPGDRNRDRRMLGQLSKNMARSNEAPLHRVRPHNGNEGRINSHQNRAVPSGPRNAGGVSIRGRAGGNMGSNMARGMMAQPATTTMNTQQQMELFKMLEQQAALIAQMAGGIQPAMGNAPRFGQQQSQGSGPSLFDRVQQPGRQTARRGNYSHQNSRSVPTQSQPPSSSAMDFELTPSREKPSPETTCNFNLGCKNPDCMFAHQSPAAPPGTAIDIADTCSFGAACKNKKCTGRHPSPAQRITHAAEQDCKFYPNCTNPRCLFRHGPAPCRNGADCTVADCKFAHVKIACKFNPCLNPGCTFKHEVGQRRGKFEDKVWVANHVSERKFVDEGAPEELIVPVAEGEVA